MAAAAAAAAAAASFLCHRATHGFHFGGEGSRCVLALVKGVYQRETELPDG